MNHNQINNVVVREYALLLRGGEYSSIDYFSIDELSFDWLLKNGLSRGDSKRELVRVKRKGKDIALQVVNFVGVLDTPFGTRIEILPKISNNNEDLDKARKILLKMLSTVENIKLETFQQSHLQTINRPLFEVLISQFLRAAAKLVKQGLRSKYQRINKESAYLKGQLDITKQLRQRAGRQHYFHISYDIYSANRAENRLLHSSLVQVSKWTKSSSNQRLVRELLFVFTEIEKSSHIENDFRQWATDRSLAHYRIIKPWCELILSHQSPFTLSGNHQGVSFLFPMEVLFERYVAKKLSKQLPPPLKLREQVQSQCLAKHQGSNWFRLKPDIIIKSGDSIISVMDTKWKVIDDSLGNSKDKYNLSQSDMYQLFAYGDKYMGGVGDLYLIYPKNNNFNHALESFEFKQGLSLYVVPYDLETDHCPINITTEIEYSVAS